MSAMSTFNVDVTVGNLSQPTRNRRVSAMVDTGCSRANDSSYWLA